MASATPPSQKMVGMIKALAFERFDHTVTVEVPATKDLASKLIERLLEMPAIEIHPRQTAQITELTAAIQDLDPAFEAPVMPADRARANRLRGNLQQRLDRLTRQSNATVDVLSTFVRPRSQSDESVLEDTNVAF